MACGLYLITCTDMLLHDPFRTMQCQNNGVLYVKRESIRFFVGQYHVIGLIVGHAQSTMQVMQVENNKLLNNHI